MKKICLVAFLTGCLAVMSYAQSRCSYVVPRQTDNWFFYVNAGIQFTDAGIINNNLPVANSNLSFGNSCAVLSDSSGNLLLYSNGHKVFNNQHAIITDANLAGDPGSPQASLIIQNPASSQMLYVFTTDLITNTGTSGLNYSRVDLTARAGNGAVMEADNVLLATAAPMVAGVRHGNNLDYWVMTHNLDNNQFYAFKVDGSGVSSSPVISSAGDNLSSSLSTNEYLGTMKFSPKGDKVAFASYGKGIIQVFSFDNNSGTVSNASTLNVTLPTSIHGPYWIEFSPDGTKLYATVVNLQSLNGNQNTLYQYDLENGAFETNLNPAPMGDDVMSIQLGRDGKIYVLRRNQTVLGVIANPNREGVDCNYDESYFGLGGVSAFNGLPNFVSSFLDIPPIDYDTKCFGDETVFTMLNTSNITSMDWNFGDPGSPDNIVSGPLNPSHVFTEPGTYTVTYTENYNGKSWTDSIRVVINPLPLPSFDVTFSNDTAYIVDGSSITMYGNPGMYSYFWQDGSTNPSYTANTPGIYTVLVEDWNCCQSMDTLYVLGLNIKIPTAFSPDGNGINDQFRALSSLGDQVGVIAAESMTDFSFTIFNKWGQMMFETDDIYEGWDGKLGSSPAPAGLYNWHMKFNVPGNTMNNGMVNMFGSVMLFR